MAEGQHGGYRQPSQPAAVSGPGALSQRTDGGATQAPAIAPGNGYGERSEMLDMQAGAPMQGGGGREALTPLDAPTARPHEPVTTGIHSVPGVQPSAIDDNLRERLSAALPTLAWLASQPRASEQTRQWFRQLRGDL